MADLKDNNIKALLLQPQFENNFTRAFIYLLCNISVIICWLLIHCKIGTSNTKLHLDVAFR